MPQSFSLYHPKSIIISRTDSIGDVVLTLPLAKLLKQQLGEVKVAFLGSAYTRPVIEAAQYVDQFIGKDDFLQQEVLIDGKKPDAIIHVFPVAAIAARAAALRIPLRIGTTNRLYHWTSCNRLIRLSRKNSPLHEAQLNARLLQPFGLREVVSLTELGASFGLNRLVPLQKKWNNLIDSNRFAVVMHPKSQGSAREWGLSNFATLIKSLDANKFQVFISGTEKEGKMMQLFLAEMSAEVTDLTGKMNLTEFLFFLNQCDAIVANSTGPLHLAAAMGKAAFGLYPPIRPMHPGRWAPLGKRARVFVAPQACNSCKNDPQKCSCMQQITPEEVAAALRQEKEKSGR